jgi:hypothetical protein
MLADAISWVRLSMVLEVVAGSSGERVGCCLRWYG